MGSDTSKPTLKSNINKLSHHKDEFCNQIRLTQEKLYDTAELEVCPGIKLIKVINHINKLIRLLKHLDMMRPDANYLQREGHLITKQVNEETPFSESLWQTILDPSIIGSGFSSEIDLMKYIDKFNLSNDDRRTFLNLILLDCGLA